MKGKILVWDSAKRAGLITGEDGRRYAFDDADLLGDAPAPRQGLVVDFHAEGDGAEEVVLVRGGAAPLDTMLSEKNKWVAAILAFFLGALGIHKFYLGKTGAGITMLLCSTVGWILILPPLIIALIAFIEMIIYIVKPEADFHRDYVAGRKSWF